MKRLSVLSSLCLLFVVSQTSLAASEEFVCATDKFQTTTALDKNGVYKTTSDNKASQDFYKLVIDGQDYQISRKGADEWIRHRNVKYHEGIVYSTTVWGEVNTLFFNKKNKRFVLSIHSRDIYNASKINTRVGVCLTGEEFAERQKEQ